MTQTARTRRPTFVALFVMCSLSAALADEGGWVARVNGAPVVQRGGKTETLQRGSIVSTADVIETDARSKVKILLADDSVLTIGPKSRVALQEILLEPKSRKVRLQIFLGRFKVAITKFLGGPSDYEIRTPTAVAGVRGTVLWGDTELDAICALDGQIEVQPLTASAATAHLSTGQCVQQMGAGKTVPLAPSPDELAAYLKEVTLE